MHRNDDQSAIFGQGLDFARHIVASDHVQNHVHPRAIGEALDLGQEIGGFVVDGVVCTQSQASLAFVIRACRGDHFGAGRFGHLNGRDANATGAALDQKGLARLQTPTVKHIAPHGKKCLGQRSGLDVTQATGHWQTLFYGRHTQLRIAAASHQSAYAVTHSQARLGHGLHIARHHHTGHFKARNVRCTWWHGVIAGALQHVGAVDAAGRHANEQLPCPGHRVRTGARHQHLGGTVALNFNHVHGAA